MTLINTDLKFCLWLEIFLFISFASECGTVRTGDTTRYPVL